MNEKLTLAALLASIAIVGVVGCDDDDDGNDMGTNPGGDEPPIHVGTWLSADADVAAILSTFFAIDSVRVTFNENQTVELAQHDTTTGTWTMNSGTYAVTESSGSDIDAIAISYDTPAFDQEGIIQVWAASPDSMWLEVVQTVPDIGATPLTPADGFGADGSLGTTNIQVYRREQ